MLFDNAFTTGSVCSPTRYAMLTSHFGKWHFGYGEKESENLLDSMQSGPNKVGFDYHFGVPGNMDAPRKVFVENDSIYGLRSHKVSSYGDSNIGAYGDFIHYPDYSVGQMKMMNALKVRGLDKNTMFIFSSVNGGDVPANRPESPGNQAVACCFKPNGEFRGDKHSICNGGFRVPTIVRWPEQVLAESVVIGCVSTLDLFSTIADLLGEPLKAKDIDGTRFGSVVLNPESDYDCEELLLRDVKRCCSVLSGNYKYITDSFPKGVRGLRSRKDFTIYRTILVESRVLQNRCRSCRPNFGKIDQNITERLIAVV